MADVNRLRTAEGQPCLEVGIGIATGPVAVGLIGTFERRGFSAIGHHVNFASRLQGQARPGEILLDEESHRLLEQDGVRFNERMPTERLQQPPCVPLVYSRFCQTLPRTAKVERSHTGVDSSAHGDDSRKVQILLIRHGTRGGRCSRVERATQSPKRQGSQSGPGRGTGAARTTSDLEAIVVSPLVATVQTAELLAERLDFFDVVEVLHSLGSGIPPQIAAKEISLRGSRVAVVGHEPALSMLGAYLTARPASSPAAPAAVSVIEDGQPRWFVHPETLAQDRLLIA